MAVDQDFILAIAQGVGSVAPVGTPAPTGMTALTTPWADLGSLSTDGLSENLAQTRTEFKRWGNIGVIKTVITDEKHEFTLTCLESNPVVTGLYYRVPTPTPDATSHIFTITDDTTGTLDPRAMVFDLVEGTNHIRFYCPKAEVTGTSPVAYKLDGMVEYGMTITAYPDDNGVAVARSFLLDAVVNG